MNKNCIIRFLNKLLHLSVGTHYFITTGANAVGMGGNFLVVMLILLIKIVTKCEGFTQNNF